ncbi:hypothetical protein V8G54_006024 [Vigna mungo]|uniref:Uncharacterized protein n=1 Tax=Vigna mungo TaxID=3915 RepID=A0AAQ3P164_VIGMU
MLCSDNFPITKTSFSSRINLTFSSISRNWSIWFSVISGKARMVRVDSRVHKSNHNVFSSSLIATTCWPHPSWEPQKLWGMCCEPLHLPVPLNRFNPRSMSKSFCLFRGKMNSKPIYKMSIAIEFLIRPTLKQQPQKQVVSLFKVASIRNHHLTRGVKLVIIIIGFHRSGLKAIDTTPVTYNRLSFNSHYVNLCLPEFRKAKQNYHKYTDELQPHFSHQCSQNLNK